MRAAFLSAACLTVAALAGGAAAQDAPRTAAERQAASGCGLHEVGPGQTLAGIAAARGATVAALLAANPRITNPDAIFAGTRLTLPCPEAPKTPETSGAAPPANAAGAAAEEKTGAETSSQAAVGPQRSPLPAARPDVAPPDVATQVEAAAAAPPESETTPAPAAPPSDEAPVRTLRSDADLPEAGGAVSALLGDALAEADRRSAPAAPAAAASPDAETEAPPAPGLGEDPPGFDLVYPWIRPDCERLERLPPSLAERCARYDFSAPLGTARIAWYVRADGPLVTAEDPSAFRGRVICRPERMFDGDLAAAGLAPPRAGRISPATARGCLEAVAAGEAEAASLELGAARRARADGPPLPELTELPELRREVTLHAAAWRGSVTGRAALAALDAGLAALRGRRPPVELTLEER
ncbi:MAG: LysM peptidoglycan-binding domain-containing protein [Pseudomonadota bacterium]